MESLAAKNTEYVKAFVGKDKWNAYQKTKESPIFSAQEKRAKFIINNMLEAMSKYDEPWWLSEDLTLIAYHQINERILLVSFEKLTKAIAFVLGREVFAETATDLLKYRQEINQRVAGK